MQNTNLNLCLLAGIKNEKDEKNSSSERNPQIEKKIHDNEK